MDKTEPIPAPSVIPGEWEQKVAATSVTWTAHVSHGSLVADAWVLDPRRPLNAPVTILAELTRGPRLTDISAVATVTHAGSEWTLPMFDDGEHGDIGLADGTYGAIFKPGRRLDRRHGGRLPRQGAHGVQGRRGPASSVG